MRHSTTRSRLGALLLGAVIMLVTAGACDNKRTKLSEREMAEGLQGRGPVAASQKIKVDPRCDLSEKVVDPAKDSPEWIIQEMFAAAAAKGDDNANFQRFFAHFDETTAEKWARDQYWPRIKQHVSKYLEGDPGAGTVYTLCERRVESPDTTKFFIRSADPSKSNPPITLQKKADGKFKVVFFTP
jgi:hypothetical protein